MKRAVLIASMLVMTVVVLVAAGQFSAAYGASPLLSEDTLWADAYPLNNQNDFLTDQQTGSGSVSQDIVGDATHPSTYMRFTADDIAFRVRVDNNDGEDPLAFKNFAFIGVDSDLNGGIDFFLGAYNPTGSNGRLGIYNAAGDSLNISPSTTGISGKPLSAYQPQYDVNYAITEASDSNFLGDPDYFVSFQFSVADISAALAGTGDAFTASTPFRFMTGTAAQDNSFNQDINGMDQSGWSSGETWNSLDVFSGIVSADGTAHFNTVTFDSNTGDTEASPALVAVLDGQPIGTMPSTLPTKRGMYFQGWNTMPDGSGTTVTSATTITADTTVYAMWSNQRVYSVTFNPNGGNFSGSTASIVVPTIGGVVGDNMPAQPTRSNRYFSGWNTAANGSGTFFSSATAVTANITVYAQWSNTANSVAVFYDNYDGTGGAEVARIFSNGNSSNFNGGLPIITRAGYTLVGWFLNDMTTSGTAVTGVNAPGNYYAKWAIATYTVTFNQNYSGAPAATTKQVTGGTLGTLPTEPTRAGYVFIEWNRTSDALGEAMYPTSLISGNTTVYAIWKQVQGVTFYANGGEFADTSTQWATTAIDGVLTLLPQPPSRPDYSFLGWSTSASSDTVVSIQDVSGSSTYYAVWAPTYTVTFNENYGSSPATLDIPTAYGSVLYLPTEPLRAGYTFIEWNTEQAGSGSAFTLADDVDSDMTVYAKWVASGPAYTVQFVTNGGSPVGNVTTNELATPPVTTRDGYTFDGWYSDEDLINMVDFPSLVMGDTTLYARWTPITYTVTLDPTGGSGGTGSVEADYDQAMPAATAPERTGYTFAGYYDDENKQYYDASMTSAADWDKTADATLYARWTANSYDVTFDANGGAFGGGAVDVIAQTYGSEYVLPAWDPAMIGYTFVGWNTESDGTGSNVTATTLVTTAQAHTVYAMWAEVGNVALQYSVEDGNQGEVSRSLETLNPATGTALGSTALPASGFEFVKWVDGDGATVSSDATFVPAKGSGGVYLDATYTVVFAAIEYPATVNVTVDNIAVGGKTVQLSSDGGLTFITLVEQPDGSYLAGADNGLYSVWVDGVDTGINISISDESSSVDIAFYTLTLEAGAGVSAVSGGGVYLLGSTVPALSATVQTGYNWSEWTSSDSDLLVDQSAQAATFTMPSGALTLTAATAPITYTVTADAGLNGSISPNGQTTVNYGDDQSFTITADSGYHIDDVLVDGVSVGAVSSYDFENVTEDHTISAVFAQDASIVHIITAEAGPGGSISPSGPTSVNDGEDQAFTIAPSDGYHVTNVLVDGESLAGMLVADEGSVLNYTFEDVTEDHTISVAFAADVPLVYTITVNAGANGGISPGGPVTVTEGDEQSFTITADSGYHIDDVLVDGVSVGAVSIYDFENVLEDHTIAAVFAEDVVPVYTITVNAGANGGISPGGPTSVPEGDEQPFTITADSGYHIDDVLVDGVSVGAVSNYTFENVTEDHTIAAVFAQDAAATYTITVNAGANGAISPGGPETVTEGDEQSFTITADSGYHIDDVLVDGVSVGAVSNYTFENVTEDHTIAAVFAANAPIVHIITVTVGGGGSITQSGSLTVDDGDDRTFTITPDSGYHIADVLVNGVSVGAVSSYTFENVTEDHMISAVFAQDVAVVHTITVITSSYGSITPGGPLTVGDGGDATFTIAARPGYAIADVLVDGVSVGAVSSYTFLNVTGDHEISATYTYVGSIPKTGDDTPIAMLLSTMILSLTGILALATIYRKRLTHIVRARYFHS